MNRGGTPQGCWEREGSGTRVEVDDMASGDDDVGGSEEESMDAGTLYILRLSFHQGFTLKLTELPACTPLQSSRQPVRRTALSGRESHLNQGSTSPLRNLPEIYSIYLREVVPRLQRLSRSRTSIGGNRLVSRPE